MVELQFHRTKSQGKCWQQSGNLFLLGSVFLKNELKDAAALEAMVAAYDTPKALSTFLDQLSGSFGLVYKKGNLFWAAVDNVRSLPLFYTPSGAKLSDSLSLSGSGSVHWALVDDLTSLEFIQGESTVFNDWRQLEAGKFLWMDMGHLQVHTYYSHLRLQDSDLGFSELNGEFSKVIEQMTTRFVRYLDGRPVAIPLSGGMDSRFVLAMLKKVNYPSITAFTYGQAKGHEAQVAQQVCSTLDIPWQFIEYNPALFKKALDKEWDSYMAYASNGVSVPQEQEYFAFMELKNRLPEDTVICPGFSGDVQAGSFLPNEFYRKKWQKTPITSTQYISERLTRFVDHGKVVTKVSDEENEGFSSFYSEIEEWVLRERVSKYVVNGVRCYEFFGFDWYLPLWDTDFVRFWNSVPADFRLDKRLYIEVLNKEFFEPMSIDFAPGGFDRIYKKGNWASWLKEHTPNAIKKVAKRALFPSNELEINNLNSFSVLLQERMGNAVNDSLPVNEAMATYLKMQLETKRKGE